jgi:protein-tyrosine phosphatase
MNANCPVIPSYICAGLYLSDWRTACLADLDALRVGLVITAMTAEELDYYGIEGAVDFEGAEWLWIAVEDDDAEPIGAHFDRVCTEIEKVRAAGKGVLIHCMAGVSRSPTLAAAWLMRHYTWTAAQALAYLKERRHCVDPNAGFRHQLLLWEQQLGI